MFANGENRMTFTMYESITDEPIVLVRAATTGDSEDLFAWRNDEATRAASISQEPVAREMHDEWFRRSLESSKRVLYIVMVEHVPGHRASAGMCRFDLSDDARSAEVSINLNPAYRGRRISGPALRAAMTAFREEHGFSGSLRATIRQNNRASAKIFLASGFSTVDSDEEYLFLET